MEDEASGLCPPWVDGQHPWYHRFLPAQCPPMGTGPPSWTPGEQVALRPCCTQLFPRLAVPPVMSACPTGSGPALGCVTARVPWNRPADLEVVGEGAGCLPGASFRVGRRLCLLLSRCCRFPGHASAPQTAGRTSSGVTSAPESDKCSLGTGPGHLPRWEIFHAGILPESSLP